MSTVRASSHGRGPEVRLAGMPAPACSAHGQTHHHHHKPAAVRTGGLRLPASPLHSPVDRAERAPATGRAPYATADTSNRVRGSARLSTHIALAAHPCIAPTGSLACTALPLGRSRGAENWTARLHSKVAGGADRRKARRCRRHRCQWLVSDGGSLRC